MKKIIDGKKYDTETAECVGGWDNGYYANDLYYCWEGLYRKKTVRQIKKGEKQSRKIAYKLMGSCVEKRSFPPKKAEKILRRFITEN